MGIKRGGHILEAYIHTLVIAYTLPGMIGRARGDGLVRLLWFIPQGLTLTSGFIPPFTRTFTLDSGLVNTFLDYNSSDPEVDRWGAYRSDERFCHTWWVGVWMCVSISVGLLWSCLQVGFTASSVLHYLKFRGNVLGLILQWSWGKGNWIWDIFHLLMYIS